MLIQHLPRDSALNRDLHGEAAEWSVTDHLLAAVVDHLAAGNWMFACVNSEESDQPEPPVPVPRPGDGSPERADATDGTDGAADGTAPGTRAGPGAPGGAPDGSAPSAMQLARFFA
ncbi:hypothetical protein ALMP_21950 [Streptomyces sp. A012304]|nr:hypothetical protein ALMP_21950 [Streptomyces sp. A012304]